MAIAAFVLDMVGEGFALGGPYRVYLMPGLWNTTEMPIRTYWAPGLRNTTMTPIVGYEPFDCLWVDGTRAEWGKCPKAPNGEVVILADERGNWVYRPLDLVVERGE